LITVFRNIIKGRHVDRQWVSFQNYFLDKAKTATQPPFVSLQFLEIIL